MTSSIRRGGYEPLPEMGEYVCDCYEHGTGEPWAHVGSNHVHEQVVRCRECRYYEPNTYSNFTCELLAFYVQPDGFCAWGIERED